MRCNDYISIDTFFFLITWPLDRGMSPRQAGWQPGWSGCCAGPGQPGFGGESWSPGNNFMSTERCPGPSCIDLSWRMVLYYCDVQVIRFQNKDYKSKAFLPIRWSGVFWRLLCTIALRSSCVLQRVATILSWQVWGKTKIRELMMMIAILYWHVWGNKKKKL